MIANGIFIGLGANLPSRFGPPEATLAAALDRLEALGVRVLARSRWYETAPVPVSDQPWYVNGVVQVESTLPPAELLAVLIGDGDKPMMMLTSLISIEVLAFARLGLFRHKFQGTPFIADMRTMARNGGFAQVLFEVLSQQQSPTR